MADVTEQVQRLMHEVAETHHRVYRITDGADDDWATWYADWLVRLSELPDLLGRRPNRSEVTAVLVEVDRQLTASGSTADWEKRYAERLVQHFA